MYVRIFALCIISFLSATAISAKRNTISKDVHNVFSNFNINITRSEQIIAEDFHKEFRNADKFLFSFSKVKSLNNRIKKDSIFENYKVWPKTMLLISKANTLNTLNKTCNNINLKSEDATANILVLNAKYFCLNKYLEILSKPTNRRYIETQKDFFVANKVYLFNAKLKRELSSLYSLFPKDSKKNILLSNIAIEYFTKANITPPSSLLQHLTFTPEFTRYLQTKDLEERSTKYVFYKELKKLMNDTMDKVDENKLSKNELKTATASVLNYFNLTLEYQPKEKALKSLLAFGKSLVRREKYSLAQKCYERILREKSYHFESTVFELMWTYISQNQYDKALAELENKYLKQIREPSNNSKLYFWLGFLHHKEGNDDKAEKIFTELISKNPLSYYAILSSKVLSGDNDDDTKTAYLSNISKINTRSIANKNINIDAIKRISLWNRVNNTQFYRSELETIYEFKDPKLIENHILAIAYHFSETGFYLDSFKVLYGSIEANKLSVNENTLKLLFPLPYYAQIKNKIKSFDPIIALSLIRQESGFNRYARSHVGARGLMQLMPGTAKRFKRRLRTKNLYNPNLNIMIGTKYFSNLMNRYNNNLVYSLAAYNAGEGRVDRWQENYLTSESILKNIENIPYLETRKYVKLIFRNIFFYKMMLADNKSDSNDLNKIYDIHLGFDR